LADRPSIKATLSKDYPEHLLKFFENRNSIVEGITKTAIETTHLSRPDITPNTKKTE